MKLRQSDLRPREDLHQVWVWPLCPTSKLFHKMDSNTAVHLLKQPPKLNRFKVGIISRNKIRHATFQCHVLQVQSSKTELNFSTPKTFSHAWQSQHLFWHVERILLSPFPLGVNQMLFMVDVSTCKRTLALVQPWGLKRVLIKGARFLS